MIILRSWIMIASWRGLRRAITTPRKYLFERLEQHVRISQRFQLLIDKSGGNLRATGLAQSNNRHGAVQALECPCKLEPLFAIDRVAKYNSIHHRRPEDPHSFPRIINRDDLITSP